MLALGLILILLAAGAVVAALFGASPETATFDLGAFSLEMNTLAVFFFGSATVLLLGVGLWLLRAGTRRATRRRHEKKELNRLAHKEQDSAAPSATSTTAASTQSASSTETASRDAETRGTGRHGSGSTTS